MLIFKECWIQGLNNTNTQITVWAYCFTGWYFLRCSYYWGALIYGCIQYHEKRFNYLKWQQNTTNYNEKSFPPSNRSSTFICLSQECLYGKIGIHYLFWKECTNVSVWYFQNSWGYVSHKRSASDGMLWAWVSSDLNPGEIIQSCHANSWCPLTLRESWDFVI